MTDRLRFAWSWLAYQLVMHLPLNWTWSILPYAGNYAHNPDWAKWRGEAND